MKPKGLTDRCCDTVCSVPTSRPLRDTIFEDRVDGVEEARLA